MLPQNEKLVSMSEARKAVQARTGRRLDVSTLWRWAMRGVHGVRLEHIRAGRELRTSREAIERFYSRLADAYLNERSPATSITSATHAAAEKELAAAGL